MNERWTDRSPCASTTDRSAMCIDPIERSSPLCLAMPTGYPGTRLIESRQIPCLFDHSGQLIVLKLYESVMHGRRTDACRGKERTAVPRFISNFSSRFKHSAFWTLSSRSALICGHSVCTVSAVGLMLSGSPLDTLSKTCDCQASCTLVTRSGVSKDVCVRKFSKRWL